MQFRTTHFQKGVTTAADRLCTVATMARPPVATAPIVVATVENEDNAMEDNAGLGNRVDAEVQAPVSRSGFVVTVGRRPTGGAYV